MTQTETLTARIDERLARPVRPPVYVEIVDPSGRVSYRRWSDHPDVLEALGTQGYTVRRCPQQPDLEGEAHPDRALLVESTARIRDLEAQLAAQAEALEDTEETTSPPRTITISAALLKRINDLLPESDDTTDCLDRPSLLWAALDAYEAARGGRS